MKFVKPNRCDNSGPNCAEIARKDGKVFIRNSNDPSQTTVVLTDGEWNALTESIVNGQDFTA